METPRFSIRIKPAVTKRVEKLGYKSQTRFIHEAMLEKLAREEQEAGAK